MFWNFTAKVSLTALIFWAVTWALWYKYDPALHLRPLLLLSSPWLVFALVTLILVLARRALWRIGDVKLTTVTLSKVHDVTKNYVFRQGLFTHFSFSADGRQQERVVLRESPQPEDGTKLSVILEHDGSWDTVYGWFNHDTGKWHVEFWGTNLIFSWTIAMILSMMCIAVLHAWTGLLPIAFISMGTFLYSRKVYELFCAKQLIEQLRASTPSGVQA